MGDGLNRSARDLRKAAAKLCGGEGTDRSANGHEPSLRAQSSLAGDRACRSAQGHGVLRRLRTTGLLAALLLPAAGCTVKPYEPFPIEPKGGLPDDALVRCSNVLAARELRIAERDVSGFRLRTHWGPMTDTRGTAQQRVTLFRHGSGLGLLVEVRYLRQGLLDGLPEWTTARPDPELERELGDALLSALTMAAPPSSGSR